MVERFFCPLWGLQIPHTMFRILWLSRHIVAGGYPADKEKVYSFFIGRPDLETPVEIGKAELRELVYKQLNALVNEAGINPMKLLMEDPARYFVVTEAVGYIDMSLGIKLGVQFRYVFTKFLGFQP